MEAEHPETNAEEKIPLEAAEGAEGAGNNATPPAAEAIHAPEQPQRSWFGTFLHFLFGADTAVGRFMRPLLRWTAFVLILFAAGLLVMYYWRVAPTEKMLAQTVTDLAAAQTELAGAREEVATSQSTVSDMQARMQAAEETAQNASQHLLLTTLRNDVAGARVSLLADHDLAAAILDVSAAELDLEKLAPAIEKVSPTLADELAADLATIKKGFNTRPVDQNGLADQLFSFDVKLLGLEKLMFPE